jgi:hypothetical protein
MDPELAVIDPGFALGSWPRQNRIAAAPREGVGVTPRVNTSRPQSSILLKRVND